MRRQIFRDRNEAVRQRMRTKLEKKRSRGRYNKRAHTAESPFGNLKWNLKFRAVMRRGHREGANGGSAVVYAAQLHEDGDSSWLVSRGIAQSRREGHTKGSNGE